MYGYVYKIENRTNMKTYIGQTTQNPNKRRDRHFHDLKHEKHFNNHLQMAFNKYGESSFSFQVLNYATSKEVLDELEIGYIRMYDCLNRKRGYNIQIGGTSGKLTEETKMKMSKNHADISGENNPMYGKTLSEEHRRRISQSNIWKNNHSFGKQRGKYMGTYYAQKNRPPWTRVWQTQINYKGNAKFLGCFNDPLSGEILYKFVFKEIHGEDPTCTFKEG